MKILLVYPEYPSDTFWGYKYALRFISKRTGLPPLGLLTVAALLPSDWELRLVDMNASALHEKDILWADYVFISAMVVQRKSVEDVVAACKRLGRKTVAGGPLFTEEPERFDNIDYLVLNEAEVTLPLFLDDLKRGCPKHIYTTDEKPELSSSPVPLWNLVNTKYYEAAGIQYSRGCPYDCEFCDITHLYGRRVRVKKKEQIIAELDALYDVGWRRNVFFVDDNFIGNKLALKNDVLPAIIDWMAERRYPFRLFTEVSINLCDDEELMNLMSEAGFYKVFVGIETPNEDSLVECNKFQNRNRNLVESVRVLQKHGFEVQGGFIVGFDSDPPTIFENQIKFIQKSGIVEAMVGLLNAPRGTRLYKRLKKQNRLLSDISGNNTDLSTNFVPLMGIKRLVDGYKHIVSTIYSPRCYYERARTALRELAMPKKGKFRVSFVEIKAFLRSIWHIGIRGRERFYYWRLFFWTIFRRPALLPLAITYSIYGYHFRRIFQEKEPLSKSD